MAVAADAAGSGSGNAADCPLHGTSDGEVLAAQTAAVKGAYHLFDCILGVVLTEGVALQGLGVWERRLAGVRTRVWAIVSIEIGGGFGDEMGFAQGVKSQARQPCMVGTIKQTPPVQLAGGKTDCSKPCLVLPGRPCCSQRSGIFCQEALLRC